jgi:hypothetical protein
VAVAGMWVWFLGLNLLWFLGDASRRRSERGWLWGTPALLGLTGWVLGGSFDLGCMCGWNLVGGGVGIGAGFILGCMLAEGRFD